MKRKMLKLTAMVMCMLTAIAFMPAGVFAVDGDPSNADSAKVYVSVSVAGKTALVNKTVTVSDTNANGKLDIDDTLLAAHKAYCPQGVEGYKSESGQYGLSLMKLWGDESGAFGYYLNHNSAWSLEDTVKDGDFVHAFVYTDKTGWSDKYSYFNKKSATVTAGQKTALKLNAAGFDEQWNPVVSGYAGAEVGYYKGSTWVKLAVTDSTGTAKVTAAAKGTYTITAKAKTGEILVPPVCMLTVKAPVIGKAYISSVKPGIKKATVSWKKVSGAGAYKVFYKVTGTKTWKQVKTTGTKKTIKKLRKGRKYTFMVRAYKKVGTVTYYGAYSAVKRAKIR